MTTLPIEFNANKKEKLIFKTIAAAVMEKDSKLE